MAGIVADIFAPIIFAEETVDEVGGFIAVAEGAIADITGFIADVEGAIADFAAIYADIIGIMIFVFSFFWTLFIWLIIIITIIDAIILLGFAADHYKETADNVANIGILLDTFFDKTFTEFFSKYLASIFQCGGKMIKNFPGCIFWYILEIIGQILYLPFRFIFWLFCMQDFERSMWALVSQIDDYLHSISGFSLIHYPDFIIQDCYMCNLEKLPIVQPAPRMKNPALPYLVPYPWDW